MRQNSQQEICSPTGSLRATCDKFRLWLPTVRCVVAGCQYAAHLKQTEAYVLKRIGSASEMDSTVTPPQTDFLNKPTGIGSNVAVVRSP